MGAKGRLTVVGTGISFGQLTLEARGAIQRAERVLYVVADAITERWIEENAPGSESLYDCYGPGKSRMTSYLEMVERILDAAREGAQVCAAFYGHPGVFVYPSHEAVRRARQEGIPARMLPGVSAEDCLFAEVGFDPAMRGCQSFEATDFLLRRRRFDPTSNLVLWQVGVLGALDFQPDGYDTSGLTVLQGDLVETYGGDHEVVLYEASLDPISESRIERFALEKLASTRLTGNATLYVPPQENRPHSDEYRKLLNIDMDEVDRIAQVLVRNGDPNALSSAKG
jgi:uncharacterized protein YabN with tetrapyrrole methylase and pyrophosphatase domain